jgi:hypoxanthine phosphoribosyltransferase
MPELIPVITESQIQERIRKIAGAISTDYQGKDLVLVGILKGAFVFLSDLARNISIPFRVDFIRVSSYGKSMESSGNIQLLVPITEPVEGSHVLLVEDIVDTGLTLQYVRDYIRSLGVSSVEICALIDKTERRMIDTSVRYVCHHVQEGFLVGYGLDYAEQYRGLPAVYHLQL